MQLGGEPRKVELMIDLTKYHPDFKIGAKGETLPRVKIGMYGIYDRFVAVELDTGAKLDVLCQSLKYEDEKIKEIIK